MKVFVQKALSAKFLQLNFQTEIHISILLSTSFTYLKTVIMFSSLLPDPSITHHISQFLLLPSYLSFFLGSKHKFLSWHSRFFHSDLCYLCFLISCGISPHFPGTPPPVNHGFACTPYSFILLCICLFYSFSSELPGKLNLIFQYRDQVLPLLQSFLSSFFSSPERTNCTIHSTPVLPSKVVVRVLTEKQ